ncbi:MAG: hypothetical protein RIS47_697 [Bacteroidota bacterium]|jgi:hypothetical protein
MKTSLKKRTWFLVTTFVAAIAIVATAANYNRPVKTTNVEVTQLLEDEIVLEEWMTDPAYLSGVMVESEIELEAWMTDPNYIE